jgi:NitT/TauT family transport system ATP-binding protein
MDPLITLENVTRFYASNGENKVGLKNVSFHVHPEEVVSLIGPSGCGKTTILKMISTILNPSEGKIYYKKKHISLAREDGLLGYIPQASSLFPNRTVEENINLPLEIKNKLDTKKVESMMDLVGLSNFKNLYPHQLSGGMKQKVSLARSLVYEPEVLLMDEPFSSLDEIIREKMDLELLKIFYKLKPAIIFVTHNIEEAVFISNRILIMSEAPGKILYDIKINLPEKRSLEIKNENAFFEEVKKIRENFKKV